MNLYRILYVLAFVFCLLITEAKSGDKIPIEVDHYGKDSIGIRIVYELKEAIRRSQAYRLSNIDDQRFIIDMISVEEFPGTSNNASIYAVVWLAYARVGKVFTKIYISQLIGACRDDKQVKETAADIMAMTDKIVSKHTIK
jgi:hypothetical protein